MSRVHFTLIAFAALANLGLGLTVLARNSSSPINRYFAFFSFSVAAWTFSNGLVSSFADTAWGYLWARVAFASASLIPLSFFFFSGVFPTQQATPHPRLTRAFLVSGFISLLASFSPLIVRATASVGGSLKVEYGPLHLPFALYFISSLGFSLYLLIRKRRLLTGLRKLQVHYLFAGVLIAAIGATVANLIIPLVFGSSEFSRYGPLFGMFMIAVIGHAIIRYRLMDIRVVIRQGVVYVCALFAAAIVFFLIANILKRVAGYDKDTIPVPQALLLALAVAMFFQPFKNGIQSSLNRYLYRESYNYQRTMREASRRLSTMLELDPLLDYLSGIIGHIFKAECVTAYLHNSSTETFTPRVPQPTEQWHESGRALIDIPESSPLVSFLSAERSIVVREEALRDFDDLRLSNVAGALAELGGDLAFPLIDDHLLRGLVIVGPKRSGDPYFAGDIDLLDTLISQAAIAMKNAQLYQQVVLVNEYLDNVLSTMESGVIAIDEVGHVSLFNQSAERLTGLTASTVSGHLYSDCLPSALASPLRETLETDRAKPQFEISVQGPDDVIVPLVCSTAILRNRATSPSGAPSGALVVFSDLSRLKDLEREKRRAERLASFGALASGVAHEIKNPLVAIRTFAELLPERFSDSDFRDDFAKVVVREISRIDDLVGRLRGIAASAPQQTASVDIREPIIDTLRLLRAQMEQTRTTVRHAFQDPAPTVAVDEAQLKQLFLNLFLNAVEAMGPGGHLFVQVSRKELRNAQWIVVEVSDNGPGIPDSLRPNIFEPFFTTKPRGSGLGLAICRGITDAHRGTIRAENRENTQGTTVVVEFPASAITSLLAEEQALQR